MSTYTSNPQGYGSGQMEPSESEMGGTREELRQKAAGAREQVKEKAQDLLGTAQERARTSLDSGKSKATSEIHTIASALHRAGEQLDNENEATVAQYAHQIADKLEDFSSVISDKSVDELVEDVERFARERPEVFLGAAFALGLIAGRFFKSSREALETSSERMAYGAQQYTSTTDYPMGGTGGVGTYGTGTSSTSTAGYGTKGGAASETDLEPGDLGESSTPRGPASTT